MADDIRTRIRSILTERHFSNVRFGKLKSKSENGLTMQVCSKIVRSHTTNLDLINSLLNPLLEELGIINIVFTSGGWNDFKFKLVTEKIIDLTPEEKMLSRINTKDYSAQPNKFGQIPEVGDYVVGNQSGNVSNLLVAEVLGWDSKALIARVISDGDCSGEVLTMRWVENLIFPRAWFKDDLTELLVLAKMQKN